MSNVIDCLQERGFIDAITSQELIEKVKKPIKVYVGFDPTADSLHLGNLVGIIALGWFQKFGHTPVVVLGGATGKIGDPSGKSVERPLLDSLTIKAHVERIACHFHSVLDFSNQAATPVVLNNDSWFSNYCLIDFLRDIGKHFRLGAMLGKESVRSRVNSEEGISFTEFSYQLLQAYDFYYLNKEFDISLQMGGSDQWGNITAGIELVRKLSGHSVYGLTFPLVTRSDGKKFGKTEGGAVWLAPDRYSPYEFYQYLFRIPDSDVGKLMRLLTFMEIGEIIHYEEQIRSKDYISNTAQRRLAEEITRIVHGEEGLNTALRVTQGTSPGKETLLDAVSLKEIAADMPRKVLKTQEIMGLKCSEVMVKINLVTSKGEAVRLIQNGGAYLNNQKILDSNLAITAEHLIGEKYILFSSGKKKKILLEVEFN